ncbi:hypothetical protein [Peptacetobacter hiranonis]|uniref:Uncharacterized protein n=1 Tax=Peptacetobacter hiranonis (strain DSM 13275 / JCM 10541 / KCTC 15199 / TO-931) TaxID=500633 RepID=B6FWS9_PEPHT|nr:hypothetical protein [Peptacetobacter hiranonis]EEA85990.1 hypothetical protein CLOHIR_00328 [Peptacetobacter hiranonis DSM 13275]QEK21123.1 hypothetical protein KGNDJEFE_01610 [Peptacetobacter hiranonis]
MADRKSKVFSKVFDGTRKVVCVDYDKEKEAFYYHFVKNQRSNGYRQIIITSELMIKIIDSFIKKDFILYNIEFMEEDDDYFDIQAIIKNESKLKENRVKLIKKLEFLAEETSIEIKRIYFKGKYNNLFTKFFIQANGILAVNEESYLAIEKEIIKIIEEGMFK